LPQREIFELPAEDHAGCSIVRESPGFSVDFAGALYEHSPNGRQYTMDYREDQTISMNDNTRTDSAGAGAPSSAPLVSVIIINYNYGNFIAQSIRSVDEQDYESIQCLVVDCGSTDNSLAAIESALGKTRRPFFKLLRLDANHGQVGNALSMLDEVSGVFVTYLDSDDVLFPDFVSIHVDAHLNDLNSAALSVSDQIQMNATGEVLAGTCHWHQKWRAFEPGSAWADLSHARHWAPHSPSRMQSFAGRLHYVPAWWSSWLLERWIWSSTSAIMFRRSLIEHLAPSTASVEEMRAQSIDSYFGRFGHSVGGTLVVDGTLGAYRRHGNNNFSNRSVLGGQTPNSVRDQTQRFIDLKHMAREVLTTRYDRLIGAFGDELYYSIAWQLMSNQDFLDFVGQHEKDRPTWERTIKAAAASAP
jgi:glycosyltransferase involved in cell wall biosynthesis